MHAQAGVRAANPTVVLLPSFSAAALAVAALPFKLTAALPKPEPSLLPLLPLSLRLAPPPFFLDLSHLIYPPPPTSSKLPRCAAMATASGLGSSPPGASSGAAPTAGPTTTSQRSVWQVLESVGKVWALRRPQDKQRHKGMCLGNALCSACAKCGQAWALRRLHR
eukprot:349874-Chlamydomonas_euryale.AAC.4